jgi:hypothetical protein
VGDERVARGSPPPTLWHPKDFRPYLSVA